MDWKTVPKIKLPRALIIIFYAISFITLSSLEENFSVSAEAAISVEDRITHLIKEATESCADFGGILELSGDELTHFDFDEDGDKDLTVLDESEYLCPASMSLFASNGGQTYHLMTDVAYAYVFARSFTVINAFSNVSVILLTEHGSSCDTFGYITCVRAITIHEGYFLEPTERSLPF